jgi:hypothetical protein
MNTNNPIRWRWLTTLDKSTHYVLEIYDNDLGEDYSRILQVRDGYILKRVGLGRVMVINATSNNISVITWRSVLLVEGTGVPRENHRPAGSHWQTLSHNVASSTPRLRVFQWLSYVTMVTIYNEPDISFTCKWPAVQKLHIYIWILFLNYDRSFVCFSNILTHKIIISVFNKAKQSIMQF